LECYTLCPSWRGVRGNLPPISSEGEVAATRGSHSLVYLFFLFWFCLFCLKTLLNLLLIAHSIMVCFTLRVLCNLIHLWLRPAGSPNDRRSTCIWVCRVSWELFGVMDRQWQSEDFGLGRSRFFFSMNKKSNVEQKLIKNIKRYN
jgi:hypothetical protein